MMYWNNDQIVKGFYTGKTIHNGTDLDKNTTKRSSSLRTRHNVFLVENCLERSPEAVYVGRNYVSQTSKKI